MSQRHPIKQIYSAVDKRLISARQLVVIGIPLAGIILSEALIYSGYVGGALWMYLLMFVGFSLVPLVFTQQSDVFQAFLLIPLFRLLNLGLPVFVQSTLAWMVLVYAPLLLAAYMLAADNQTFEFPTIRDLGLAILSLPLIVAGAALLATVEYQLLNPAALISSWDSGQLIQVGVVMIFFVGLGEELIFRGILQRTLEDYSGRLAGISVSSLVFGILHSGFQLPSVVAFGIGVGLLFALLYDWLDNLIVVTFLHGILNVFLFAVYPIFGPIFAF